MSSHSIVFPNRLDILRSTSAPISLSPFSYRESWPWLTCNSRANCFWVISKPRSSRSRLPTVFQLVAGFMGATKNLLDLAMPDMHKICIYAYNEAPSPLQLYPKPHWCGKES